MKWLRRFLGFTAAFAGLYAVASLYATHRQRLLYEHLTLPVRAATYSNTPLCWVVHDWIVQNPTSFVHVAVYERELAYQGVTVRIPEHTQLQDAASRLADAAQCNWEPFQSGLDFHRAGLEHRAGVRTRSDISSTNRVDVESSHICDLFLGCPCNSKSGSSRWLRSLEDLPTTFHKPGVD